MIPNIPIVTAVKLGLSLLAGLALVPLVHQRNHWKAVAADRQTQLVQTRAAFDRTIADYRDAAERARQADAANKARAEAQQSAINSETEKTYEARIADARAGAGRQRAQLAAAANPHAGGAAPMPDLPAAAQGASEAPGEDRFPLADRQLATEQAIQLDELIKWIQRQQEVRVDGASGGQGRRRSSPSPQPVADDRVHEEGDGSRQDEPE